MDQSLKTTDFDYDLPESKIAKQPPAVRGSSKLLILDRLTGEVKDSLYKNLADYLRPGDLLVINQTKVIKARLKVKKANGAERELLILEIHGQVEELHRSKVMYRGKINVGDELSLGNYIINASEVYDDGTALVESDEDLLVLADQYGQVPLPPYMKRESTNDDNERYQTVFAKDQGSVAAPTASLNLTDEIITTLEEKGIRLAPITLHVGLGTFMPIRVDDLAKHKMHQEYFEIPAETIEAINQTKASGGRVVALGTTVTRALEFSAAELDGMQIGESGQSVTGEADIFIYPGYEFRIVDALLTNFHAPKSTVLMMASAFAGPENLKNAYQHALKSDYKFLSYGDSMLIL